MLQNLSSQPANWSERILCYYENVTQQMQLARIDNLSTWQSERVVFPGQRFLFEAPPDALLQVYGCTPTLVLLNSIPCLRLRVIDTVQRPQEMTNTENLVDLAE